jgi:hypothetical protein
MAAQHSARHKASSNQTAHSLDVAQIHSTSAGGAVWRSVSLGFVIRDSLRPANRSQLADVRARLLAMRFGRESLEILDAVHSFPAV